MSTLTSYASAAARDSAAPAASNTGLCIFRTDTKAIEVSDGSNYLRYDYDSFSGIDNNFSGSFDGTDDQINCGTSNALDPSSWTINQWIKLDALSNGTSSVNTSVTRRDTVSPEGGFQVYESAGNLAYYTGGASSDVILKTGAFSANTWYMVTVTHDGSTVKGYIDGSFVGSASDTYTQGGTGTPFYIGFHALGGSFPAINFDGLIDETSIWSSVLSANEISTIYNSRAPIDLTSDIGNYASSNDLVGWWRMGDGSGDTDSGGGTPASGDTIGTVKNIANPGTHDGTASGAVYSNDVVS
jgi:hypothetical protein